MAIQTGGTTRIGNSGELQNIASVDSTTAASITAAGVGGGGATSAEFGFTNTSGVPFGFVSSHTRYTKDLEPGGIVLARKGNFNITLYHRPSPTSSSGETQLATTTSSHFCYVNTTSSTYKVWLSGSSEGWVFNF